MRKNEMHQGIFNLLRMRRGEADRVKNLNDVSEKDRKKRRNREEENREDKKEIWSVKVSTIRNRLSDKKRTSDDRWNRFAGTEDGGGRGR